MDRQAEAKARYDRLKKTLNDDGRLRKRSRRARALGLSIAGVWVIVPALFFEVDVESAATPEFFRRPTPHEAYLLDLVGEGRSGAAPEMEGVRAWEAAAFRAIDFPVSVGAAYQEVGLFPPEEPHALGFLVHVPEGQRVRLSIDVLGDVSPDLFVDVFRAAPESLRRTPELSGSNGSDNGDSTIPSIIGPRPAHLESGELENGRWYFDAPQSGDFVVRLQPQLGEEVPYRMTVQVGAPWVFPVAGAGEDDIGGVFGDPRDGGSREHHGVDIFMPRGTPALAASDGRVTSVDTTDIGGRVVWLREADGGHGIYYAHLETPLVLEGQQVQAGDTLGLIGNTGNARNTPPHLHFGAYRRGARDPWNLILPAPPEIPPVGVDTDVVGREASVGGDGVRLRQAPSSRGPVLTELSQQSPIRVLAGAGDWYRIVLPGGATGFVAGRLLAGSAPNGTPPPPGP